MLYIYIYIQDYLADKKRYYLFLAGDISNNKLGE